MSAFLLRSTLVALASLAPLALHDTAVAATLLQDDFNKDFTWTSLSDESLEPLATLVVDPAGEGATDNYVLRFIRKNDARIFRPLPVMDSKGNITVEFRVLKTGSANTAGLWLVDHSGQGIGFFLELNTLQSINRAKILSTTDAGVTQTLIKALPNVAAANPPGDSTWHKVSFAWDTKQGAVSATIDGNPAGEVNNILPPDSSFSRAILQGGFPSTLYLDDVRASIEQ